jgi:60 kDa SS-A/Ro ribonucleoprotein
MTNYLSIFARAAASITPQSRPIPGTVANSAGGHVFAIDDWARLDRFLVLGAEGGSYYAGEAALTRDNAQAVLRAIAADGVRAVARIVATSEAGRAPKNDPALFALALAAASPELATRRAALAALPRVARTGMHLFQFAGFVQGSRGWGRALRRAVGAWYLDQPVDRLAYQLVKYRQRDGWSHRDLLRLAHPQTTDPARASLLDWACAAERNRKVA